MFCPTILSQEVIKWDTDERKPGENVDSSQWKDTIVYERNEAEYFPGTRVSGGVWVVYLYSQRDPQPLLLGVVTRSSLLLLRSRPCVGVADVGRTAIVTVIHVYSGKLLRENLWVYENFVEKNFSDAWSHQLCRPHMFSTI